jgi:Helix-turn-helix domain of resolvase/Resolvase, N terminal domain
VSRRHPRGDNHKCKSWRRHLPITQSIVTDSGPVRRPCGGGPRGRSGAWAGTCGSLLAEFERSLIRERTQAGLAAARRAGRTGGRPPKLTDDDIEAAKALLANPDIGVTQIAHRLGVSPATLYRYIPGARTAKFPDV